MFSPRTPYSKTPVSGSKLQRSSYASRKNVSLLTPTSRLSFTPGSHSRNTSLSRSFQTSVIEETSKHILESYGNPLPALVTEAIALDDRITDISVKFEESGWACLVCGRRLFIWKYKQDTAVRSLAAGCRELMLPPSDLAHKAELVHVFMSKESHVPSALAVSPEGIVRYWPNIVHEGSSVEATTDLQGQECFSLTSVYPFGCILATTTSSLVLVMPTTMDGQHNIICHTLKVPQGVLAGIGRKVSSFIFGAFPTQGTEVRQLNKVLSSKDVNENEYNIYVLSSGTFQKWHLIDGLSDSLLYELDLDRNIKEGFLSALWNSDSSHLHQLKTWCLDMQLFQDGVVLLVAGMNTNISHQIYFAFATLNTSDVNHPTNFTTFTVAEYRETYQIEAEERLLNCKFILPSPSSQTAYFYTSNKIICIPVGSQSSGAETDSVDFSSSGNIILGAGSCDGLPLFFTQFHGLLAMLPNQPSFLEKSAVPRTPQRELIIKEPQDNESGDSSSVASRLRQAMCSYFNNNVDTCHKMIQEMFPSLTKPDSALDKAAIELSNEMIDDYPVSDPRWCESVPTGDSGSSSLIILHQLDDKLKAHEFLFSFLKAVNLFDKLSKLKIKDADVATVLVLHEHAEKLIAAKAIRRFLVDHYEILNAVIKETLEKRKIELKNHLTHQDMFFREVSCIDSLFVSLIEWEERKLVDDQNVQDTIKMILTVNNIFVGVFQNIFQYRQNKDYKIDFQQNILKAPYVPWTSSEGPDGMRTLLKKQHSINCEYTLKSAEDIEVQGMIFQQVAEIIDFILSGYIMELEAFEGHDKYHSIKAKYAKERNQLIQPLVQVGQFERAANLAEKYEDFDILVQICEETSNKERLQRYMLMFKEKEFSEFVFKWYLDKGKRGKLLVQPMGQQDELTQFLKGHENLNWLHQINNSEYGPASQTLKRLAIKETQYLSKKKTLLSLSKLAALASDTHEDIKSDQIDAINMEQELVMHQETMPETVAEAFGLDPDTMRVLTPEELIEMYVSDENSSSNAYDFKIALDLLHFLKKPPGDSDYENLRQHIWCKAILRDNWEELDTSNPVDAIKETVFFQIIELALDKGIDIHDFLVPVDDLLESSELSELSSNPNFIFLLRAAYEYIMKNFA